MIECVVVVAVSDVVMTPAVLEASAPVLVAYRTTLVLEATVIQLMAADEVLTSLVMTLEITGVTQDEAVSGLGSGDSSPDAVIQVGDPADTVLIRRERSKGSNGRVYEVSFTADDGFESCDGVVQLSVPRRRKLNAVDDGQFFDSTQP